jgi:hypothetical protein
VRKRVEPLDVSARSREPLPRVVLVAVRLLHRFAVHAQARGVLPCIRLRSKVRGTPIFYEALARLRHEAMPLALALLGVPARLFGSSLRFDPCPFGLVVRFGRSNLDLAEQMRQPLLKRPGLPVGPVGLAAAPAPGAVVETQLERRVQITLEDGSAPAERTHEDRGDGTPVCNIPARSLRGQRAVYKPLGQGEVTCGNCARVHG